MNATLPIELPVLIEDAEAEVTNRADVFKNLNDMELSLVGGGGAALVFL